jgi:hypothetical protein
MVIVEARRRSSAMHRMENLGMGTGWDSIVRLLDAAVNGKDVPLGFWNFQPAFSLLNRPR